MNDEINAEPYVDFNVKIQGQERNTLTAARNILSLEELDAIDISKLFTDCINLAFATGEKSGAEDMAQSMMKTFDDTAPDDRLEWCGAYPSCGCFVGCRERAIAERDRPAGRREPRRAGMAKRKET